MPIVWKLTNQRAIKNKKRNIQLSCFEAIMSEYAVIHHHVFLSLPPACIFPLNSTVSLYFFDDIILQNPCRQNVWILMRFNFKTPPPKNLSGITSNSPTRIFFNVFFSPFPGPFESVSIHLEEFSCSPLGKRVTFCQSVEPGAVSRAADCSQCSRQVRRSKFLRWKTDFFVHEDVAQVGYEITSDPNLMWPRINCEQLSKTLLFLRYEHKLNVGFGTQTYCSIIRFSVVLILIRDTGELETFPAGGGRRGVVHPGLYTPDWSPVNFRVCTNKQPLALTSTPMDNFL